MCRSDTRLSQTGTFTLKIQCSFLFALSQIRSASVCKLKTALSIVNVNYLHNLNQLRVSSVVHFGLFGTESLLLCVPTTTDVLMI